MEVIELVTKQRNTKKKMASLGLKKDSNEKLHIYNPNDTTSEFVPVRKRKQTKENKA